MNANRWGHLAVVLGAFCTAWILTSALLGTARAQSLWLDGYGSDSGWGTTDKSVHFADVTQDGRDDVVLVDTFYVRVAVSTGTGLAAPAIWNDSFGIPIGGFFAKWPRPSAEVQMADVSGDGVADILLFGTYGTQVMVTDPSTSSFADPELWSPHFGTSAGAGFYGAEGSSRHLADVNADGLADLVGFTTVGVEVALNGGAGFGPAKLWSTGYGTLAGWTADHPKHLADVNGDGRADVVGFSELGPLVSLSTGKGFVAPALWSQWYGASSLAGTWTASSHERQLGDVDGDGRADIVGFYEDGTYVSRSTGDGFALPELWVAQFGVDQFWSVDDHVRLLADVDGDDRLDVVGFGGSLTTYVSTGVGFSPGETYTFQFPSGFIFGIPAWQNDLHPRRTADLNGDGYADFVGVYYDGVRVLMNEPPPMVYGHPLPQVKVCYEAIEYDSSAAADPTTSAATQSAATEALLASQLADAEALQLACEALCQDTQPYILDQGYCQVDSFWQSPCGMRESDLLAAANADPEASTSVCYGVVGDYFSGQDWASNSTPAGTLKPETTTDIGTEPAGIALDVNKLDYSRSGQRFSGMSSHYYGTQMSRWTNLSAADLIEKIKLFFKTQAMAANGARVRGCFELVYEKYYEVSRFFDLTSGMGHDYWAMFDLAYHVINDVNPSTGEHWKFGESFEPAYPGESLPPSYAPITTAVPDSAIGKRGVLGTGPLDKVGTPLDSFFPAEPQNKNAYFDSPIVMDPALRAEILAAPSPFETVGAFPLTHTDICLGTDPLSNSIPYVPRPESILPSCPWLNLTLQDQALYDTIRDGRLNHTHIETWQWHEERGLGLREDYLEEELDALQFEQEKFIQLLTERAALVQQFKSYMDAAVAANRAYNDTIELPAEQISTEQELTDITGPVTQIWDSQVAIRQSWVQNGLNDAASNLALPPGFATFAFVPDGPLGVVSDEDGLSLAGGAVKLLTNEDQIEQKLYNKFDAPAGLLTPASALEAWASYYESLNEHIHATALRIEAANLLLEIELEKAVALGCLDFTEDNPCDWSPKKFIQRIQDNWELRGEMDYQRCIDDQIKPLSELDDNGDVLSNMGNYPTISVDTPTGSVTTECRAEAIVAADPYLAGKVTPNGSGDWTAASRLAEYYPRCFAAWQSLVIDQTVQALGGLENVFENGNAQDISLNQADSDVSNLDDDDFGVGMSYDFGWRLPTFESLTNCKIDPYVNASFGLFGKVFGIEFPIFDAGAKAGVYTPTKNVSNSRVFEADAWVEVLGYDLLPTDIFPVEETLDDFDYHVLVEGTPSQSWQQTLLQVVVPVGPIPLTLKAGVAGTVGLHYHVAGGVPTAENCEDGWLRIHGELAPTAGLDVFASASVDLLVVEAGIQANLTLVSIAFPFAVDLAMNAGDPSVPGDSTILELTTRLDMRLSFLSGVLKAFVKICYIFDCERFEKTIFRWDGVSHTINLFQAGSEIELGDLRVVQGQLSQ